MFVSDDSFLAAVTALSKDQIQQAGHRYTPGVDPDAPNLRIESLLTAVANVACGVDARARFEAMLDEFSEAWERAKYCSQRRDAIQKRMEDARTFLPSMMDQLREQKKGASNLWPDFLSSIESELLADMEHWRSEEAKLRSVDRETEYSSERDKFRDNIDTIGRCLAIVRDEREYTQNPAFKVLFDPNLLVIGEWGTGKTHLMCDFTQGRIGNTQATVLVLAKNFKGSIVSEICSRMETGNPSEVFDRFEKLAYQTGERAVVIVDGVNEGNRLEWRKAVSALRALIAVRPNIGLIVTCRTPFESIAMKQKDLEKFHKVVHFGFDDQEFDAQAAFFQYYKLPLPEVPLLNREFSRPLTLKLICQSLQTLTGKKSVKKGFAGIASGQKGMNHVLESFVNSVGKPIEREFDLRTKGCWELLKGNDQIADRRLAGFAPCMAENPRGNVFRSEADRIIAANYPALKPTQRRHLLEALRTNGLIEEDAVWSSTKSGSKPRFVFRLPYQRFSDHLIARHLLKTHLNVSSAVTIKRSFTGNSQLARIFRMRNRYDREYAEPGLAQALIAEFPERVKKQIPTNQRELYFVLPKRARNLNAYFEPFIEGLFWRNPAAFSEGTRVVISQYLTARSHAWERMIDVLVAIATKPKHPYHARRLYDNLARYSMPDRDLLWSEYLRRRYASPTIHRLMAWAEKFNAANMTQRSATELVVLLSLVLTTVVRSDRDLATKALVFIGERFPEVLFSHTVTTLEFNDSYVPERMLAAAYGTTLSLVDSKAVPSFLPLLGDLAKTLYLKMFGPGARNATHHALMRDYALGIIEIAQRVSCVALPNSASKDLSEPFPNTPSTFASDGTPDPTVKGAIDRAIQVDFGNYTIGRLIPDRRNYDASHPDYIKVRAKIERRIFDLGYRAEFFKNVDYEISRTSMNAHDHEKVDRYGKKYSWIAYFEMWGEREAERKLPDLRLGERTSDCGVDPSFPKRPPHWTPPIPDLFGDTVAATEAWVKGGFTPNWRPLLMIPEINGQKGEWVLIEGFVRGIYERHDRDLFAFLRGLFIARKDVDSFRSKFLELEYPGNNAIPEGASQLYLYAGEAGRRQSYARHLRQRNGRYRRQIEYAFDQYVHEDPQEWIPPDTIEITSISEKGGQTVSSTIKLKPIQKTRRIPSIRVEVPYIEFGWESYHSSHNNFSGFNLPAPSLIQRLHLKRKSREIDFYDSEGKLGTLYREAGDEWKGDRHTLFYVRADLLQRYLTETRQVLVWCNWGERDWLKKMEGHDVIRDPVRMRVYQAHNHIHRSFFEWSAKDRKIIR